MEISSVSKDETALLSFLSGEQENIDHKKSILVTRGRDSYAGPYSKRGSSRATIQWKDFALTEDLKIKKSSLPFLGRLLLQGSRRNYIHDLLYKLTSEETKELDEEMQGRSQRGIDISMRDLWSKPVQKHQDKGVTLSLDQQAKLELLKYKVKAKNDHYLKQHPELNVLLVLTYRMLFKTQPEDSKLAVANFVHYLNTHREEMVLEEVDVSFERPSPAVETSTTSYSYTDEDKVKIQIFARDFVERCWRIASQGEAYANVTTIVDSMLRTVSPSEYSIKDTKTSTEEMVSDILKSLLMSVTTRRTNSAEIVVNQILSQTLENICPSLKKDSESYMEVKESVERFVQTMLNLLAEKEITLREKPNESDDLVIDETSTVQMLEHSVGSLQLGNKPILKKIADATHEDANNTQLDDEEVEKIPRVKFQSVS